MAQTIRVEVVYALPERQVLLALDLEAGVTMREAVLRSRIAEQFPGLVDPETIRMGVFGKPEDRPQERVMRDGERIELYRPLLLDPRDTRRARAQRAKKKRVKS